jgi:hypothetical protein
MLLPKPPVPSDPAPDVPKDGPRLSQDPLLSIVALPAADRPSCRGNERSNEHGDEEVE